MFTADVTEKLNEHNTEVYDDDEDESKADAGTENRLKMIASLQYAI